MIIKPGLNVGNTDIGIPEPCALPEDHCQSDPSLPLQEAILMNCLLFLQLVFILHILEVITNIYKCLKTNFNQSQAIFL